jgi:hypothetical protein
MVLSLIGAVRMAGMQRSVRSLELAMSSHKNAALGGILDGGGGQGHLTSLALLQELGMHCDLPLCISSNI